MGFRVQSNTPDGRIPLLCHCLGQRARLGPITHATIKVKTERMLQSSSIQNT